MGYVYLLCEEGSDAVKVGFATSVEGRLASLQTGSPRQLFIRCRFAGDRDHERAMHEGFRPLSIAREWFNDKDGLIYNTFSTFAEAASWGDEITAQDIIHEARWWLTWQSYIDATGDEYLEGADVPPELHRHPNGPFGDKPNPDDWVTPAHVSAKIGE